MRGFLLVDFATAAEAREALANAKRAGHPAEDLLTPVLLDGGENELSPPPERAPIGWIMFVAGALGAVVGYAMQWYSAVIDYPIRSGGRALNSWPVFLIVPYETTILSAAIVGVLSWIALCRLPKLFHPLFGARATSRAVQDRYVLVFSNTDAVRNWVKTELPSGAVEAIDS